MKELAKNYFSTVLFLWIGFFYYTQNSYYENFLFFDVKIKFLDLGINTYEVFVYALIIYLIFLIPFYLVEGEKSKARIVIGAILKKLKLKDYKISSEEKNCILGWLVKFFYVPLMLVWLVNNFSIAANKVYSSWIYMNPAVEVGNSLGQNIVSIFNFLGERFLYFFDNYLFLTIYGIILFIDILIFTCGYMIESKYLNNKIKSVEPTLIGWIVALLCYPPFSGVSKNMFGWYSETFPYFANSKIHVIINTIILLSFIIYVRASIALGFKASNLTNRGIVARGPYKYVRHPAYFSKNLARILGALPIIIGSIKTDDLELLVMVLFSLVARFTIYYARAITEEKHLSQDPDYLEYKKKVKYKYIPKVF